MRARSTIGSIVVLLAVVAAARTAAGQLGARSTDEWIKLLESPERVAALKIDQVIARLGLKPGQVVADLGAGAGAFTLPLAKAVGPSGKVYAVEIDQGLVDHIGRRAKEQGAGNIQPLLGKPGDPALPSADVDLAFMHDVLHHIADRPGYLKQSARYLKPGARFAIIEPDAKAGPHRDDPKLQTTKEQLTAWMADAGLVHREDVVLFGNKWFVVYERK